MQVSLSKPAEKEMFSGVFCRNQYLRSVAASVTDCSKQLVKHTKMLDDLLHLHSVNQQQLLIPRCRLDTYGRRAFTIASPTVWNSLPYECKVLAHGSDSFKQFLKTIVFSFY